MTIELTPEEARAVERALASASSRAKQPFSLDRLVARWRRFVDEVAAGYGDSIYEYTNDLGVRELLEKVMKESPEPARAKIAQELAPLDSRFDESTQPAKRPLGNPTSKWSTRVPTKIAGELERDLRSEGYL